MEHVLTLPIVRSYIGISFKTLRKPWNLSNSPLWDSNHKPSECMWLDHLTVLLGRGAGGWT